MTSDYGDDHTEEQAPPESDQHEGAGHTESSRDDAGGSGVPDDMTEEQRTAAQ